MSINYFPQDIKKGWMLYFSALLTWSLVTYLSLMPLAMGDEFIIRASAFILFIILFIFNISNLGNIEDKRTLLFIKISLVIKVLLAWLLIHYDRYDVSPILLMLIATQFAQLFEKKPSIFYLLIINTGYYLLIHTQNERGLYSVLIFFLLQLFAYSAMDIMIKAEKDREKLAEINQELLATRFMLKESSQRKERLRISRDLHDVIGHQLTALSLNLEVSYHKVSAEFKPMLKENLSQAKTLLSEVREVVKEMRNEEQFELVVSLQKLVEQLPNCQLVVDNPPTIHSLALKQQLIFCLQEGISNALRHGKADLLTLNSMREGNVLSITLTDNGKFPSEVILGSGLKGMKERLEEFKGKTTLLPFEDGCQLKIEVEDCYD